MKVPYFGRNVALELWVYQWKVSKDKAVYDS
jgi:hypothetical protein